MTRPKNYRDIDTFHGFSGGIDSTYNMWRWLKENPDKTLLVHHITYYNNEGGGRRGYLEKEAVGNILNWFNEQGLTNYVYHESILDITDIPRFGLDTITMASLHGTVLLGYRGVSKWIANTPKNEYNRIGNEVFRRRKISRRIVKMITGRDFLPVYSLADMTKKQIMTAMPPELLELCWYCRRPTEDFKTCGECHTCKQVLPHLK